MGTDSPEELYTWTGEGLAMLLPGEYADTAAGLHIQRAIACKLLERPEEMATELAESERAGRASRRWSARGRAAGGGATGAER